MPGEPSAVAPGAFAGGLLLFGDFPGGLGCFPTFPVAPEGAHTSLYLRLFAFTSRGLPVPYIPEDPPPPPPERMNAGGFAPQYPSPRGSLAPPRPARL